jgi:small subunit ribosomal protein S4e
MARMSGKKHLKALSAPRFWPVLRKEYKWAVKPSPGPHPAFRSIPLLIIVRNMLGYAKTAREARRLIVEGHFKIDGRVRRDYKFPVGLMDVVEVVDTGETYRMIPVPVKIMDLIPIDREEAAFKLGRIEDKTTVKGGHIQLHLHDGRNILVRVEDPKNPVEASEYKTLGTVKITVPDQEIQAYIPLKENTIAVISGGRNVGRVGRIRRIRYGIRRHRSIVELEDKHGNLFETSLSYIFPIGVEKPLIKLPEGAW